ncbi:hypothetical protein N9261_00550 [bacterium]|nr:hypothetical protein [bacterium]
MPDLSDALSRENSTTRIKGRQPEYLLHAAGLPPKYGRASFAVGLLRYLGGRSRGLRRTDLATLMGANVTFVDRAVRAAKELSLVRRSAEGDLELTAVGEGAWMSWATRGRLRRLEVRTDWRRSPARLDKRLRCALQALDALGKVPSLRQLAAFLSASRSGVRRALRRQELRGEIVTGWGKPRVGFSPPQKDGRRWRYVVPRRWTPPPGLARILRGRGLVKTLLPVLPVTRLGVKHFHEPNKRERPPRGTSAVVIGDVLGGLGL